MDPEFEWTANWVHTQTVIVDERPERNSKMAVRGRIFDGGSGETDEAYDELKCHSK